MIQRRMLEVLPPHMFVAVVGTVVWGIVAIVLGIPLIRYWTRRLERRDAPTLTTDVNARLARIEAAVDSIAIEVERISENQRFLTKLQTDRPLASGSPRSERER
jgi:hypothetical protein